MSSRASKRNLARSSGGGKKFRQCHGQHRSPVFKVAAIILGVGLIIAMLLAFRTLIERPNCISSAQTAHYASIPGLNLYQLSATGRAALVEHLNQTPCSCDCAMTVAQCRNVDPECEDSQEIADRILAEWIAGLDPASRAPTEATP